MRPIWKDYEVNLGNAESVAYTIECDGAIIYSGIAVRRPNESNVKVVVNRICANYLHQTFPNLFREGVHNADYAKTFTIKANGVVVDTIEFSLDYSYDYAVGDEHSLSLPIDGVIDYRMPLVRTNIEADYLIRRKDLTTGKTYVGTLSDVSGNYVKSVTSLSDNDYTIEGSYDIITYHIYNTCARYALYYVNAYGGWDALVMQGTPTKSAEYKRYTMQREYVNADSQSRGEYNYATEVTEKMSLKTALLTDEQVSRMHHLLGSTQVMLYDIEEKKAYPVIIIDSSAEYKTFKGNGGKRSQYTINIKIASNRERR